MKAPDTALTREIEAEWTRNVIAKQNADPQAIQDCLEGMRAAAEGWEAAGYAKHIGRFELVDAKDLQRRRSGLQALAG